MPLIATAGDIKHLDISMCGIEGMLSASIIERLPQLQQLQCVADCEVRSSKLKLPPASVCSGGLGPINKFFFASDQKDLEDAAEAAASLLESTGLSVAPAVIRVIEWLLEQGRFDAPMVQQLWVSLVSSKNSNLYVSLVEAFLDKHLDCVSVVMKWRDNSGRTAEATALTLCKRAMSSRAYFMGCYDVPSCLQHEYMSATCKVYLVEMVSESKRTRVALKFMKNADEFEREKSSRDKLLGQNSSLDEPHSFIIETMNSYPHTDPALVAAIHKYRRLVDYDSPSLLVMPAADRNLRSIMDNERITNTFVIKDMFRQILDCVNFMHYRGLIHCDLKPRNIVRILLRLKLIDLDASAQIGKQYAWSKHSSAYMPPEAICLTMSAKCSEFVAAVDPSSPFRVELSFSVVLPSAVSSNQPFTVSLAPIHVYSVQKLVFDHSIDASSGVIVSDGSIIATLLEKLDTGKHEVSIVAVISGVLPAADAVSVRLQYVVNSLILKELLGPKHLVDCVASVRNPAKDAEANQTGPHDPSKLAFIPHGTKLSSDAAKREHRDFVPETCTPPDVAAALPPYLSESAIDFISSDLPPHWDDRTISNTNSENLLARQVSVAQCQYKLLAGSAQLALRSMRDAWISWQQQSSRHVSLHDWTQVSDPAAEMATAADSCKRYKRPRLSVASEPPTSLPAEVHLPPDRTSLCAAPVAPCRCSCDNFLPPGLRSGNASIPSGCIGLCGVAHVSHDMWALGVILYRLCVRRSLWSEDDDDNIKDDSGHLLELAQWTDSFKQERLLKIDDTATRLLVSKLLEKQPWMRPGSINEVLNLPFDEADVIRRNLGQMAVFENCLSSNLVGSVKDLHTGQFKDAAYGLRAYLQVDDSWDELVACSLEGMQAEVDLLKDCPDCARVQADVLQQLGRSGDAAVTYKLALALADLQEQRRGRQALNAARIAQDLRMQLCATEGWYYGLPNSIKWPCDTLKVDSSAFCQPMCKHCQKYCLDYSSISADLRYIMHEAASEKTEWNGIRDRGRAGRRLADFMKEWQAAAAQLTAAELAALRLYTSHSFNCINIPMRDTDRKSPHPLPGIVSNIQRGLKKLRALGSAESSSKQTVVLWRGMGNMQLPPQFSAEGGTELAPMSTTTDLGVAIGYAVKKHTRSALLFRFVTRNNLERGADVQWLSMFPGESETLFPPLTFIQRTRAEPQVVVHNGVTVTVVELSTTLA